MKSLHIHLDVGRSPASWSELVQRRQVWDTDPYGYLELARYYDLSYSVDIPETRLKRMARRLLARAVGFDFIHAWRNRKTILGSDFVITHTEHEYLAILLLARITTGRRGFVLCQSIWLWDRWQGFGRAKKMTLRVLLQDALVHTVHSSLNLKLARLVLGDHRVELVPFGITPLPAMAPSRRSGKVLKVLTAGNDKDRDWKTLGSAVSHLEGQVEVLVRSRRARARAISCNRVLVQPAPSIDAYWSDLEEADVVVVPLKKNMHASGVTVVIEALSASRRVVVADTGGLRDYFGDIVEYYEPGDARALAHKIAAVQKDGPEGEGASGPNSRKLIFDRGLTATDYALRHHIILSAPASPIRAQASTYATIRGVSDL